MYIMYIYTYIYYIYYIYIYTYICLYIYIYRVIMKVKKHFYLKHFDVSLLHIGNNIADNANFYK